VIATWYSPRYFFKILLFENFAIILRHHYIIKLQWTTLLVRRNDKRDEGF